MHTWLQNSETATTVDMFRLIQAGRNVWKIMDFVENV
jgi:hypothetical protein